MKKVLFATTALIATASVAAADVRISGYGRFGLDYNDANDNNYAGGTNPNYNGVPETTLTSRLRLQFDVSTETDGGVGFNARVRMQAESRDNGHIDNGNLQPLFDNLGAPIINPVTGDHVVLDNDDNGFNGARFGVSYGGLLVNVGNIIGAIENSPGLYLSTISAGTGVDGMGYNSVAIKTGGFDAYSSSGQGVNGVEALYTMGGFTGHISYSESNDLGIDTVTNLAIPGESRAAIMLTYSWNDYYVTGSYQDSSDGPVTDSGTEINDLYFLAIGGQWNQFGAALSYGDDGLSKSWTLQGDMDFGTGHNVLLWVNDSSDQGQTIAGGTLAGVNGTAWGINYQYDLGGGATFVAGYEQNDNDRSGTKVKQKQFQAGVYFSF